MYDEICRYTTMTEHYCRHTREIFRKDCKLKWPNLPYFVRYVTRLATGRPSRQQTILQPLRRH